MINTAEKKKNGTVVLLYDERINFHRHSQESTVKRQKRQFLQKNASNLLKSRAAVSVKANTI